MHAKALYALIRYARLAPFLFRSSLRLYIIIINNVGHWPILLSHVHHSIMHSRALDPSHSSNQTECPEQNLSTASWAPLISSEKGPINMWVFSLFWDGFQGCQGAQEGVSYSFPCHTLQPERSQEVLLERIYNPNTAMGFSEMFTFYL